MPKFRSQGKQGGAHQVSPEIQRWVGKRELSFAPADATRFGPQYTRKFACTKLSAVTGTRSVKATRPNRRAGNSGCCCAVKIARQRSSRAR
jgi:hypothetical protein